MGREDFQLNEATLWSGGPDQPTNPETLPKHERIGGLATGDHPGLAALYVQYGRYLMIASSRPGTQPAASPSNSSRTLRLCSYSAGPTARTTKRAPVADEEALALQLWQQ